jgi:hypothetical protein
VWYKEDIADKTRINIKLTIYGPTTLLRLHFDTEMLSYVYC